MSILDEIARFGEALKKARRYRQTIREINALPPEIQKDIGWPEAYRHNTVNKVVTGGWY